MIGKLFEQTQIPKNQRKTFVPFVNQRNFMGTLITDNPKRSNYNNLNDQLKNKNLALIQNLKKSSKEYFFDKKYSKMAERLKRIERQMKKKDYDYDYEYQVSKLFKTLNDRQSNVDGSNHTYYIDLKQSLNQKISNIKENIISKIQRKRQAKSKKRTKTIHLEQEFQQNQLRMTKYAFAKYDSQKVITQPIDRQVFRTVSKNSQFMADFSNEGLKYRHMVYNKKLNPWKTWYVKQNIEIFPGKKVSVKKLQKSIY